MSVIKRIYRSLLDKELGVLGGELEAAEQRNDDQQRKIAALQDRFERLVNRVSMRLARSGRSDEAQDRDILETLTKARKSNGSAQDDFGPDPWGR